jgi:hypothetical protein
MDDGLNVFRDFNVASLLDGGLIIFALFERRIIASTVSNNVGTWCYGTFSEADKSLCASLLYHSASVAPC